MYCVLRINQAEGAVATVTEVLCRLLLQKEKKESYGFPLWHESKKFLKFLLYCRLPQSFHGLGLQLAGPLSAYTEL